MNLLLLSKNSGCKCNVDLGHPKFYLPLLTLLLGLCGGLVYGGYEFARLESGHQAAQLPDQWREELRQQQEQVALAKRSAQENVDALALRLGQLQARMIRLDALGKRLVQMADLDKGEFDFESEPAQGGPNTTLVAQDPLEVPDFLATLDDISQQLADREHQLTVLTNFLMNSNLQAEVLPAGRPVKSGWISSYFGKRTDPFTGKQGFHEGIDFAGKKGSDVVAVAAGVVTYAGRKPKYGGTVEINHGNGYVTRYAHNMKNLVKVGDTVKKGDVISLMGSSGRSTGPHVHFEVLREGAVVNPLSYIRSEQ